jgi:hypothetical protein
MDTLGSSLVLDASGNHSGNRPWSSAISGTYDSYYYLTDGLN